MTSSRPQKRKKFRRSLPAKLVRKRLEQQSVVAHSLFESAEHPAMQPEANSKRPPHSPAVGSQTAQRRSRLVRLQLRERSKLNHSGPPAVAKIRARQPEPRFSLSRDSRARFCQSPPETGRQRVLLRRATARQRATLFAAVAPAWPRLAAELLSCMGCHTCRRVPAGVRFSAGIHGSSPLARPNPLGVDRDRDATSWQAIFATVLETSKSLEAAGAPQPKAQRLSEGSKVSHRANKALNGCPALNAAIVRSWQTVPERMFVRESLNPPAGRWDRS